ncbi:hypothetical protein OFM83_31115, partial [Escherichia coli]|nr:hypothetical protein [Escherichia coli]
EVKACKKNQTSEKHITAQSPQNSSSLLRNPKNLQTCTESSPHLDELGTGKSGRKTAGNCSEPELFCRSPT